MKDLWRWLKIEWQYIDPMKLSILMGIQILWLLILLSLWRDAYDHALTYAVILIAWKIRGLDD